MGLKIIDAPEPTPVERPRISLCMIMRDEEEHLARCLRSVEGVVDEIIIVDTGSVDRSIEIAESFGAQILHEEWQGDFAAPRNTGLDVATGDWILMLDADEELIDGMRIHDLVRNADLEEIDGFCFREVNFIGEEVGIDAVVNSAFRLWRHKPHHRYSGALHEQIMGVVDQTGGSRTRFVGLEIYHYGYLEPTNRRKKKEARNMEIVLKEVEAKPDDSFTLFNAGVEFQRIGQHQEAIEYFQRSFQNLETLKAYYASLLLRNIIASLNAMERFDEAIEVITEALAAYPDFTDMHYLKGQTMVGRREYRGAISAFRTAIELGDGSGHGYMSQAGMGSFYSWHALGSLYVMIGDQTEAVRALRRSIQSAPGFFAPPLVRLTQLMLTHGEDPAEVEAYMRDLIRPGSEGESFHALASVFLAEGDAERSLALAESAQDAMGEDHAIALTRGLALMSLGRFDAASELLRTIPETSERFPHACANRFLIALMARDSVQASQAADDMARTADPDYANNYRVILAAIDEGVQEVPGTAKPEELADVAYDLAKSTLECNDLDAFNALTGIALAATRHPGRYHERIGHLLVDHGFEDPGIERLLLAIAEEDAPAPDTFARLARISAERGDVDGAIALMDVAIELDPQNLGYYIGGARILAGGGRYDEASDVLTRGLATWPHSTVLSEVRESLDLLAQARAA